MRPNVNIGSLSAGWLPGSEPATWRRGVGPGRAGESGGPHRPGGARRADGTAPVLTVDRVLTPRTGRRYSGMSLCVPVPARPRAARRGPRRHPTHPTPREGSKTHQLHETKATTVRTYTPKPGEVEATWHVIDATDVVLGRLAAQAATLLRGKHKATFAPHVDGGDFVIVINAAKVALTGNKRETKMAYRHSGYPGGLRATPIGELLAKRPERVVETAVRGMLPKTTLARDVGLGVGLDGGLGHWFLASCVVVGQQPGLLSDLGDLEGLGLLRRVRVLGTGVDLELVHLAAGERRLGQHPPHSRLHDALGTLVKQLADRGGAQPARVAGVPVGHLGLTLVAGQRNLGSVDHDDEVTPVDVRGEGGLVLATEQSGGLSGEPAQDDVGGVDHVPGRLDLAGLRGVRAHGRSLCLV